MPATRQYTLARVNRRVDAEVAVATAASSGLSSRNGPPAPVLDTPDKECL